MEQKKLCGFAVLKRKSSFVDFVENDEVDENSIKTELGANYIIVTCIRFDGLGIFENEAVTKLSFLL